MRKDYVIELHATFTSCAESYDEALDSIYGNIDLNETEWEDELVAELSHD